MEQFCKLIARNPGKPEQGADWKDTISDSNFTLKKQIIEDKKYGKLDIHSDGKIHYAIMNYDREMTRGATRRAINAAMLEWEGATNIDFKRVKTSEHSEITVRFVDGDEYQLFKDEPNVLAVMWYPIAGALRGTMLINKAYPWTLNGEAKSGKWIEEKTGQPIQFKDNMYRTWSLFKVTRHELGHGLGLPHSKLSGQTMSGNYSKIADHNTPRDESRIRAKYGATRRSHWWLYITRRWLRIRFG